jgi:Ca2+-binding EF-hand superfamily protein
VRSGLSFAAAPFASNRFGARGTLGCELTKQQQFQRVPRVARQAEPESMLLGGFLDVTKMMGETTIILQCCAATSLVLAGKYLIAKEEEEEKERTEKEEAAAAAGEIVEKKKEVEEEYDIWRDSLLRYLGYSNELGEALRPVLPAAYLASYCLAFAYVFADSVDKGGRADKKKRRKLATSAFLEMDSRCEGYLSKEDVKNAFKKMETPLADADVDKWFASLESSSNERVDLKEFLAAYEQQDEKIVKMVDALEKPAEDGGILANPALVAASDALIWQVIASVALPGFTINRFVTLTEIGCEAQAQSNVVAEYFPTVLGLAMIPLICKPLDELADIGLDNTLRPVLFSAVNADKSGKVEFEVLEKKLKERDGWFYNEQSVKALFKDADSINVEEYYESTKK